MSDARLAFTSPKGFDYTTLKAAIAKGAYPLTKLDLPERPGPSESIEAVTEMVVRADGFRPRFDPPPNT